MPLINQAAGACRSPEAGGGGIGGNYQIVIWGTRCMRSSEEGMADSHDNVLSLCHASAEAEECLEFLAGQGGEESAGKGCQAQ